MSNTLETRLGAGIAAAALLLAVLLVLTYRNTQRLVEAGRWVQHSQSAIEELQVLVESLKDAESSQRGYLLTGNPADLAPYESALVTVGPRFTHLIQMTADNPSQQARISSLRGLVSERLRLMQDVIALRGQAGLADAARSIATGAGQRKMNEIRDAVAQIGAAERSLLGTRNADSRSMQRTAFLSLWIGAVLLFASLGLIWALIRHDLLKRHAAEQELRFSEAELRTTLRSIGEAVLAADEFARVTFVNPVAEKLTGWNESEARGRPAADVFRTLHETTREELDNPVARVLRDGAGIGLASRTILKSRDGGERLVSASAAPIRDDAGRVSGVVLVFRDVTERRAAERELQRLAAIVSSSEDAIVAESLDGTITAWNAAAERLFGYSASEVIGRSIDLLDPAGPEDATGVTLIRIRKGERVQQYDTTRRRKDGQRVSVSISVSPILDGDGRIIGASKIARDIGERKRSEAALRASAAALEAAKKSAEDANRAKDHFLAALSHELRTPLTPALATAQVLEMRADLPEDIRSSIEAIRRNIELEGLLVDDLLDLTKIARGKIELRRESLDLHTIVESAAQICRSEALAKRQALTVDLAAREHFAEADAARLQQVLWNLIKNAVKFTPDGGSITVRTENPSPGRVRLSVADTGVGIRPDLLARIFEPFQQGEDPELRRGGLGLGLSICKNLVELHGGAIRVESGGEGRGAVFSVELTATLPKPVTGAQRIAGETAAPGRKPLSILVVEDHADTATALAQLLDSEGHAVTTAGTLADAVALYRQRPFDLFITDLGLPDGSGHDLLRQLRQIRPARGIVLSGYGMDADIARSSVEGFEEHLIKPVNIRRLVAAISRIAQDIGSA
jgi:two-component system, chemotaxis family, CheB/CheR fusion protein